MQLRCPISSHRLDLHRWHRPHKFVHVRRRGLRDQLGGAELTLGTDLIADQLRSIGPRKRAIMTIWMEKMHASFGASEKL